MKNFKLGLFDLSEDDISTTKMFYEGKIIKCLIAPFHTEDYFVENLAYNENIFLFPENQIPRDKLSSFISMLVKSKHSEMVLVTSSTDIIIQMIGCNVRVLTEAGNIVPCPTKTFMANIHDIRYNILENKDFKDGDGKEIVSVYGVEFVKALIDKIRTRKITSQEEYDDIKNNLNLIGEDLIRVKLLETLKSNFELNKIK